MFKDILVTVDLDHESSWKKAIPVAVKEAQTFGARLHVLTVVPTVGMSMVGQFFPKGYEKKILEAYNEKLHAFVTEHIPSDIKVQHIIGQGTVYEVILKMAKKTGCDLIVIGAHRPELKDYLLGPNAARVVRHADCSVMVVRD
ncbi:universal stress protein [Thalassospira alkalitolerans]|uniref:Universal stress protein n=1 Tax=Thalassospira alkalitolerans TaxID=1293890 RepID=A0A1Y2LFS3_9PROT|nr:universal stress protein [Thalassospira alkalitolerans]OSQ49574.1 universal stress protein UspA [Thalassospira alkalitolerans]|tara:strand:- start:65044 stop:65472 length:429 start_codon:yes stop_codon:yes gene_type:complete